jgi:starch phosphorylase
MDGTKDIRLAADELAAHIPGPLAPLARLAYNYAWSWLPGGHELFATVDPERFEQTLRNPVRLLQETTHRALARAAADDALVARARALENRVNRILAAPPGDHGIDPERPVAFLCAEFGIHVSLPVYSGGLGALAGDILKEASDLRVPMVAVGLMYGRGYFRQRIDAGGWQHEYWVATDPERTPAALVSTEHGEPLTIAVPVGEDLVQARIWRVDVGRVRLYLLDTDFAANDQVNRWITGRLYEGDTDFRLAQYTLLGVGAIRALRAMGIEPGLLHLNEGHAMLAPIEFGLDNGASECTVFTTHTPVPAGNDSYPCDQVRHALSAYTRTGPISAERLIALGRTHPENDWEPFGITQVALRLSRHANGVSRRHGQVAREMWTDLWPGRSPEEVPISHVTNGVHIPTWLGGPMRRLLERHLGPDWLDRAGHPETWAPVAQIPDAELWKARCAQRRELLELATVRATQNRLERTDTRDYIRAAALDPDALTIGFARRVATYKRLEMLMRDPDQAIALLAGDPPVQLLLAGKAHPRDDEAKRMVQRLFELKSAPGMAERVVFLDDYDLATGAALTRGCDVWLNLPRPPLEASGTSGMKSAVNGGLQLSVLDGWWAEAYDGTNGWAISGEVEHDHAAQDQRDSETLNHLLTREVRPLFYDRDASGLPVRWLAMVRRSLITLAAQFSATRMVCDYVNGPYRS